MGVDGVNGGSNPVPVTLNLPENLNEVQQQALDELGPIIDLYESLKTTDIIRVDDDGKVKFNLEDLPELDEADLEDLESIFTDLEELIALLQAEQDEETIAATKARIDSLKGQLKSNHDKTMAKLTDAIDQMKKQEASALANKILGWLGAIVAVVVAAVMCLTVGGSVAAVAVIAAVVGLATQVMNETGAMEKITKAIAKALMENEGMDKAKAEAVAAGILAGIQIAISVALMVGGGFASAGAQAEKLTDAAIKALKIGMLVTNSVMAAASISSSIAATVINYIAQMKQAEVTEMQAILLQLQTLLEQESEDLKQLLEKLQECFGDIVELLESKQETLNKIGDEIAS